MTTGGAGQRIKARTSERPAGHGGAPGADDSGKNGRQDASAAIVGYPVSGMIAYGGIGWLVGQWTHISALFPVGLAVGLVLGIAAMFYRYGRR